MEIKLIDYFFCKDDGTKIANEEVVDKDLCQHMKNLEIQGRFGIETSTTRTAKWVRNIKYPVLVFKEIEYGTDYDIEETPYTTIDEVEKKVRIQFCPVCGDRISMTMVDRTDVTDEAIPVAERIRKLEESRRTVAVGKELIAQTKKLGEIMHTTTPKELNGILPYAIK